MTSAAPSQPELPSREPLGHPPATPFDGLFRRVLRGIKSRTDRQGAEPGGREGSLRRLLETEPSLRYSRLLAEPGSRGRGLCLRLLAESEALLATDSEEAERLALLALFLAERLETGSVPAVMIFDYQARAWTLAGRARTTYGALQQASMAFQLAGCLLSSGSGDVELQETFLRAKARLYRARGEEELARRAEHRARIIAESLISSAVCS